MKTKLILSLLIALMTQFSLSQNAWAGRFIREDANCRTRCTSAQKSADTCHDYRRPDGSCYQVITSSGGSSSSGGGTTSGNPRPGSGDLSCRSCPNRCTDAQREDGCHDYRDSRTGQCCVFIP
jgi:hypothetical protein